MRALLVLAIGSIMATVACVVEPGEPDDNGSNEATPSITLERLDALVLALQEEHPEWLITSDAFKSELELRVMNGPTTWSYEINGVNLTAAELALLVSQPWNVGPTRTAADDAVAATQARFGTFRMYLNRGDAFRHAYWNVLLSKRISVWWAQVYTTAHESESTGLDKEMDLHNNQVGREMFNLAPGQTDTFQADRLTSFCYRRVEGTNQLGTACLVYIRADVRVRVSGISVAAGQYVCGSVGGQPTVVATRIAQGVYEIVLTPTTLPATIDTVFWLSGTATCSAWIRDFWPASNAYAINGTAITRCVPRPENAAWRFVRGTVDTNENVLNSGSVDCPGGIPGGTSSSSARVAVRNIVPGNGQSVCASVSGQPTRVAMATGGGTYEATFTLPALPTSVDTVFWLSNTSTCTAWVRDYWPAANPYSINGVSITRCVPRPENAAWRYVRGSINSGGAVADSGSVSCPQ